MTGSILSNPIRVYALGGLHEVGKNMYCIESEKSLIIVDSGVKFPSENLVGVDYVVPDYTHLKNNQFKIKALFITHGHEDHIGGIPFLVQTVNIPVIYAPPLAAALIRNKLEEHKVKENVKVIEFNEDVTLAAGEFQVSFFRVTHSIPDSFGIVIDTPSGRIVTTGDFKIDLTPVGPELDLRKIARIGEQGVDLLMADSTNAAQEGYTPSERNVLNSLHEIFNKSTSRIILSTFSSNISRIEQVAETCVRFNRKICVIGRSMESAINLAKKSGYITVPASTFIDVSDISKYRLNQLCILCTGSQGESLAALARIANGNHKQVRILPGDSVIFSSNPIPGNGVQIDKLINALTRLGANVITTKEYPDIHSSGHPSKQELRLMQKLLTPKYFMPVHGEYYMLKSHAKIATSLGVPQENIFICSNGDTLILQNHNVREGERVQADDVFIDGNDINGISTAIIKDRRILKDDGMVEVFVAIDSKTNSLLLPPVVKTIGFVAEGTYKDHLVRHASMHVKDALNELMVGGRVTFSDIKNVIKATVTKYLARKTQRYPMIIPVIINKNM